jgi:hypothetical protein
MTVGEGIPGITRYPLSFLARVEEELPPFEILLTNKLFYTKKMPINTKG